MPETELTSIARTQTSGTTGEEFRRFQPTLALGYGARLHSLNRLVCTSRPDAAMQMIKLELLEARDHREELRSFGMSVEDLEPTSAWIAALQVLRDLCSQGWSFVPDDDGMLLRSPGRARGNLENPEEAKRAVRKSFEFARQQQFTEPATASFIQKMERQGIGAIFEDGPDLHRRIVSLGKNAISPSLTLIEPGARDEPTGILLQDIWRYSRLYWSIPYQSTPGRNMFYLIRDEAVAARPIIGIAALGNPVLGLAKRDDFAGWTSKAFRQRILSGTEDEQRTMLMGLAESSSEAIRSIYSDDLGISQSEEDWESDVELLLAIETKHSTSQLEDHENSSGNRSAEYHAIREAQNLVGTPDEGSIDWVALAKTSLYTSKRASAVSALMKARAELQFAAGSTELSGLLAKPSEHLIRAIETALRRVKQDVMASSVMELITCGALPPYRDVLGGKLVAMLMTSRQVVADHARRYQNQTSIISSSLAGRRIVRPARLAMITTSSLYAIGSAQYNRISIPAKNGAVKYVRVGMTDSFGTVHFAADTTQELTQLAALRGRKLSRSNNLFGEGTSAKMRTVRSGLDALGLRSDVFLRHHSPRVLYAVPLCSNYREVLLDPATEPEFLMENADTSTALIIEHWRDRWFGPRVDRISNGMALSEELRADFLLGAEIGRMGLQPARVEVETTSTPKASADPSTFIERLYRGANSYADRLTTDEINAVNVDLGVEAYIRLHAQKGSQIVVTGNPGDGKTHLIERMRPELEGVGAVVITDANALSDDALLELWVSAREAKKTLIIAINEWPLYVLHRHAQARDLHFVGEALRQVKLARYFAETEVPEEPKDGIVTVDLGLRNLLSAKVVDSVILRLTEEEFYTSFNQADPALRNRDALLQASVRSRLIELLDGVAVRRGHITMRQLMGFVSYLITGGRTASERLKAGQDTAGMSYWNLAFEGGEGPLFDALREGFDPANCAHPDWDDRLWRGAYTATDWPSGNPPAPAAIAVEAERAAAFAAQKRQFYFEHPDGRALLELRPSDDRRFAKILRDVDDDGAATVRLFIGSINRFYEPDFADASMDRLHLWQSHRYDVRAPSAFISVRDAEREQFEVQQQQFASWVDDWLPSDQRLVKTFALVYSDPNGFFASVEIDRDLYLTLQEAHRGLGKASWLRTSARRLTRLIDSLDRQLSSKQDIEDVRIRNVDTNLESTVVVNRSQMRFELN